MAVLNTNLLTSSSRRNVRQYPFAIIALDPNTHIQLLLLLMTKEEKKKRKELDPLIKSTTIAIQCEPHQWRSWPSAQQTGINERRRRGI